MNAESQQILLKSITDQHAAFLATPGLSQHDIDAGNFTFGFRLGSVGVPLPSGAPQRAQDGYNYGVTSAATVLTATGHGAPGTPTNLRVANQPPPGIQKPVTK